MNISTIKYHIGVRVEKLYEMLAEQILAGLCFANDCESETQAELQHQRAKAGVIAAKAIMEFPKLRKILATDVEAAYNGDPAAMSHGEIISCYPVIKAITNYRIAHVLHSSVYRPHPKNDDETGDTRRRVSISIRRLPSATTSPSTTARVWLSVPPASSATT